ncbi:unnamed protein product [Pieris brassicae]|uniref:Uncharacterized protein n=1 Tax=Pieris brassicae TaxID=7116 RepID=A0A9P0TC76_PIEBR|nr:unnamed protein product [Pieris brassicae]
MAFRVQYRQERARPARVAVPGDTRRAAGAERSTLTRPGCGARRPADVTRTTDTRGVALPGHRRTVPSVRA